jgi:hypothetical protein
MNLLLHVVKTKLNAKGKGRRRKLCASHLPGAVMHPERTAGDGKLVVKSASGLYFLLVLSFTRKIKPLVIKTVRVTSNINIRMSA